MNIDVEEESKDEVITPRRGRTRLATPRKRKSSRKPSTRSKNSTSLTEKLRKMGLE